MRRLSKIRKKIEEYKKDSKNPTKNLIVLKENYQKIKEFFEKNFEGVNSKALIDQSARSIAQLEGLSKLRTRERALKVWSLAETSKFVALQISKTQNKDALNLLISKWLLELKLAPEEIENAPVPSLLSGLVGIGLAAFPVWSYISIIIGAYHLLSRDYRNRIMGLVVLGAVVVGLFVNYFVIR